MSDPMKRDILNQPERLAIVGEKFLANNEMKKRMLRAAGLLRKNKSSIFFVGMGGSNYAAIPAINRLADAGIFGYRPEADEFLHYQIDAISDNSIIIAVSQSGESAETRKIVEKLQEKCIIIAVTNNEKSSIAMKSDIVLPVFAGEESTVSTKTFTNSLFVLNLLAEFTVRVKMFDQNFYKKISNEINIIREVIKTGFATMPEVLNFLDKPPKLTFIARGDTLAAACIAGLICKESTGLQVDAISGGAFRHGPLEITGEDHGAFLIAPEGSTYNLMYNLARDMSENGSRVVMMTDSEDKFNEKNIYKYILPTISRIYSSIEYTVPLQIFTRELALQQGRVPGVLNKATKVTEIE